MTLKHQTACLPAVTSTQHCYFLLAVRSSVFSLPLDFPPCCGFAIRNHLAFNDPQFIKYAGERTGESNRGWSGELKARNNKRVKAFQILDPVSYTVCSTCFRREFNDLRLNFVTTNAQVRHTNRQGKPPRPGASWIDIALPQKSSHSHRALARCWSGFPQQKTVSTVFAVSLFWHVV